MRDSVRALFQIQGIFHYFRAFKTEILHIYWVVPENIRTPTTGGIEILPPPHAFGNSKMLYPPRIWNSRLLYPPSLSEFQRCFRPLQNFLFNLLNPPRFFFGPLKKMQCILNLNS